MPQDETDVSTCPLCNIDTKPPVCLVPNCPIDKSAVSEAEVEAAAAAIDELAEHDGEPVDAMARAALSAAAQVRAREREQQANQCRRREVIEDYVLGLRKV